MSEIYANKTQISGLLYSIQ